MTPTVHPGTHSGSDNSGIAGILFFLTFQFHEEESILGESRFGLCILSFSPPSPFGSAPVFIAPVPVLSPEALKYRRETADASVCGTEFPKTSVAQDLFTAERPTRMRNRRIHRATVLRDEHRDMPRSFQWEILIVGLTTMYYIIGGLVMQPHKMQTKDTNFI